MTPSRSVMLFGTEEPTQAGEVLRAGPLEVTLDDGALRWIRIGGVEGLRGVAFLARDENWGTYAPRIANQRIERDNQRFEVTYDAEIDAPETKLRYAVRIEGKADGSLRFEARGETLEEFLTCRTGFVVLHPLEGVVGRPVRVEHTDGRMVDSVFPELIDPACPFHDIRALSHELAPGVTLQCRMTGDAFEMEDHRNWMDASFKTYIRPIGDPWPYTIPKGEKIDQSVEISLTGAIAAPAVAAASPTSLHIGGPSGLRAPLIGLAAAAEDAAAALQNVDVLAPLGAAYLLCRFDPRAGHGPTEMRAFAELGEALGTELALEAVAPCLDESGAPTGDVAVMQRDIDRIREAAEGVAFTRVSISPAADLKSTTPGSVYPPAPPWEALFAATRAAFPKALLGGGMFSYFTELNRKRPPAELLDFIHHAGCPIVHAGDDASAMENLEAAPWIFKSVKAFGAGKPHWIFPTGVSMRENPYGAAPADNPENIRQAMNGDDPRDRGLFGAAWRVGYASCAAQAGVAALTLGSVGGPSGVACSRQSGARATPSHMALREMAACADGEVLGVEIDRAQDLQALAVSGPGGRRLLLANLTGDEQPVRIDGFPGATARILDETSFARYCADPSADLARAVDPSDLRLAPYAVVAIDE